MDGKNPYLRSSIGTLWGFTIRFHLATDTKGNGASFYSKKCSKGEAANMIFSLALLLQFLMDDVHCGWMSDESSGHKAKTNQPVVYYSSIILKRQNGFSVNETASSEWKLLRREAWNIAIMKFNYVFPPSVALCRVLQDILIVIHEKLIGTDHGKWRWKGERAFSIVIACCVSYSEARIDC